VFSLIGDFFSPHQRAFVAALVQIAMGAGMSLGQLVAGVLGARRRPSLRINKHLHPA
jgi:MFS family permease